ncbi:TlpA family protein disulfide reductase [Bordetella genomosp. 4]|uniref:Thioredoxin n=1 Tax=Bordetella genomosp. 4 TaxID=463044 RepID=A0A261USB8_9BORD|nr:TlpA disulfide reductase family protein [Bordetella genomosp. 4]OZI53315.1 thioredoxin [Bordetella genomosp. 4]OZI64794.1 thioredoxin [Bordetella genomosp. 4]
MNRRLFLYAGAAVAAAAAGGYAYRARQSSSASAAAPGPVAADPLAALRTLSLPDLDGKPHRIDQWQGRPVVVNFWATWCAPCVKEMPELQSLQEKYPKIQFVGIGVDKVANMRQFLQKVPVSYPLLVMEAGAIDTLRTLGNPAGGLPFTLVFDANGGINRKILGQIQFDDLDRTLSSLAA